MVKTLSKVSSAVATAAVLFASVGPATFAQGTTVIISGNGAFSSNNATVNQATNTVVTQTNTASISNSVSSTANTGGNTAFGNTGGNTTIETGKAVTSTDVSNSVNSNVANVSSCNCADDTKVKIAGNGVLSDNTVDLTKTNTTTLTQDNDAKIVNKIDGDATTGDNDASLNTGGNVTIRTGNAGSAASVDTMANQNIASIGGGTRTGHGGSVDLEINGNGAFSVQGITADLSNNTIITQLNDADIRNTVDIDAETGGNVAFGNTGGMDKISTGNAVTGADVTNKVNRNVANVATCNCMDDVMVDIAGNGVASGVFGGNTVELDLGSTTIATQDNDFDCSGYGRHHHNSSDCAGIDAQSDTGDNAIALSTAQPGIDPSIMTGSAQNVSSVTNVANENVLNDGSVVSTPTTMPNWLWLLINWGM